MRCKDRGGGVPCGLGLLPPLSVLARARSQRQRNGRNVLWSDVSLCRWAERSAVSQLGLSHWARDLIRAGLCSLPWVVFHLGLTE